MFWIIEYLNGTSISENEKSFKEISTENIKSFYYLSEDMVVGFEGQTGIFFINNLKFDFKTGNGPYLPIQFKTGLTTFNLDGKLEQNILARNIGYSNISNNYICKYILNIYNDYSIYFNAIKEDLKGNQLDLKKIRIR